MKKVYISILLIVIGAGLISINLVSLDAFALGGETFWESRTNGGLSEGYSISSGNLTLGQFDLSTANKTGSYSGLITSSSCYISPNGKYLITNDVNYSYIERHDMSTPWDVSTANKGQEVDADPQPEGITCRLDGSSLYATDMTGFEESRIVRWGISNFDISTITENPDESLNLDVSEDAPSGFDFGPNGKYMYVLGLKSDKLYRYVLSSNWSLSTATRDQSINADQGKGLSISNDGRYLFIGCKGGRYTDGRVEYYVLSKPFDLSTASKIGKLKVGTDASNRVNGVHIAQNGGYLVVSRSDSVSSYKLGYGVGKWVSEWKKHNSKVNINSIIQEVHSSNGSLQVKVQTSDDGATIGNDSSFISIYGTGQKEISLSGISGKYSRVIYDMSKGVDGYPEVGKYWLDTSAVEPTTTYELTISISPSNGGSIDPFVGSKTYEEGTTVTLNALPNSGYTFSNWSSDVSSTSEEITVTMTSDISVTANFEEDVTETYSLTTSVSPFGSGSVDPSSGTYQEGEEVTLTATPAQNYKFSNWTGNASGTSREITITMNSDKNVTANFVSEKAVLSTTVSGQGSVSPSSGAYNVGTTVTLEANAYNGWEFQEWSGDVTGSENPKSVKMDRDKVIEATFIELEPDMYTLTVKSDPTTGGSISITGTDVSAQSPAGFEAGTVVTVKAEPYDGFVFDHWSGDLSGGSLTGKVTMDSDKEIVANFEGEPEPVKYDLNVDIARGSGTVEPSSGTYEKGSEVVILADPDESYDFHSWGGDVSGSENPKTVVMDSDREITASFDEVQPDMVTLHMHSSPTEGGSIQITGEVLPKSPAAFEKGTSVTVEAHVNEGYKFVKFTGAIETDDKSPTILMDSDKGITANFEEKWRLELSPMMLIGLAFIVIGFVSVPFTTEKVNYPP